MLFFLTSALLHIVTGRSCHSSFQNDRKQTSGEHSIFLSCSNQKKKTQRGNVAPIVFECMCFSECSEKDIQSVLHTHTQRNRQTVRSHTTAVSNMLMTQLYSSGLRYAARAHVHVTNTCLSSRL